MFLKRGSSEENKKFLIIRSPNSLRLTNRSSLISGLLDPPTSGVLPELVDQSPSINSLQNLSFVVIPHGPTELLIRHAAVLLLLPPELSNRFGLQELEDAIPAVLPFHQTLMLLRVDQDVPDKLPKVGSSWSMFAFFGLDEMVISLALALWGSSSASLFGLS